MGGRPSCTGDGEQSRDFTYVDDVVAANLRAADAGSQADGGVFNVGAGRAKTVNDVLRTISDVLGRWIEPTRQPKRAGDVRHTLADISRAREILGWAPKADWESAV